SIATTIVFNAFPIARSGGLRSARMARQLISEGWSLVLFPEGSRTPDGWVGEFRTGAAWLAMEAGVPVVPVALIGAYQAMPRGRTRARRPPGDPGPRAGNPGTRAGPARGRRDGGGPGPGRGGARARHAAARRDVGSESRVYARFAPNLGHACRADDRRTGPH